MTVHSQTDSRAQQWVQQPPADTQVSQQTAGTVLGGLCLQLLHTVAGVRHQLGGTAAWMDSHLILWEIFCVLAPLGTRLVLLVPFDLYTDAQHGRKHGYKGLMA